jgi:hypothetical protein
MPQLTILIQIQQGPQRSLILTEATNERTEPNHRTNMNREDGHCRRFLGSILILRYPELRALEADRIMPFLWQRYSRRYKGVVMNTDIEPAAAALGDRIGGGVWYVTLALDPWEGVRIHLAT